MAEIADRDWWYISKNPDALLKIGCPPSNSYASYGLLARQGALPPRAFRRLQLFGCTCARMVWELLSTDARNAVAIRERFADGRASDVDLRASALRLSSAGRTAKQYAKSSAALAHGHRESEFPNWEPSEAAQNAAKALASHAAGPAPRNSQLGNPVVATWHAIWNDTFNAAREHQAELVRDIFPPPGYTPDLRSEWRTSTVVALARQMDETGDFSAVPILADALQDAGCDDEVMLGRCRAPSGIHCRGNWVVDLVLGRE